MKKRLILASIGVVAVLVGVAAFAANTAQWVNITAHVEKEIAVACVDATKSPPVVTDCGFGTVFPQNTEEKVIEVAISKSFRDQTQKSGVLYWALWECKLQDPTKPASATNLCLENLPAGTAGKLDGNIRNYITVTASSAGCMSAYTGPTGGAAKLLGIGNGVIDKSVAPKCLYHLLFKPPACADSFNPNTEPSSASGGTVTCNKDTSNADPQQWTEFTNLGDDFKIQVYDFAKG